MIITDTLLASREAAGSPIRVGIAGPGFMAKGLINHITNTVAGQVVAVVFARTPEKGVFALENAGIAADAIEVVDTAAFNLPVWDSPTSPAWGPSDDPAAKAWSEKINEFDGYVFVVAEYNHSITGALKNALD